MNTIADRALAKMIGLGNNSDREDNWLGIACSESESIENLFAVPQSIRQRDIRDRLDNLATDMAIDIESFADERTLRSRLNHYRILIKAIARRQK